MKKALLSGVIALVMMLTLLWTAAFAESLYTVSTSDELKNALGAIAAGSEDEAVIVLTGDVQAPNMAGETYITSFGVDGKHITVRSEGEMKKFSFPSYGILTGDCTFDNVNVTGSRLFCNGYNTVFTENGQIHLSETLYGGGYKKTVDNTHVVIAASGCINPSSTSGLHDVIGGSYQGSVESDTYLEITGDIRMMGGNHVNPGCMNGDGSSGDGADLPPVYVGGNATLIYDNKNSEASPAIEGTYGCEMKGNVTLDIRAGGVLGIVGTEEPVDKSIIRGDLHIIAGSPKYENTDRILRLNGNWPIIGAGHSFATMPGAIGNYAIGGNITIDAYENAWGWDKDKAIPYDVPEIYGAYRGDVGGNITINANGSHVENITGAAYKSTVQGNVIINATGVELKNSYYEDEDYDEGDIYANYSSTIAGRCEINVNGGDVNIIRLTNGTTIKKGSQITITGSPKIRTGVVSTSNYAATPENVTVRLTDCKAEIPFIQSSTETFVENSSNVKLNGLWLTGDLTVEEGCILKTDDLETIELTGNAVVNGTWEQLFVGDETYFDAKIAGTMSVGEKGQYVAHGTTIVSGNVTSCGMMALMKPSQFGGKYEGSNAELRLPAVKSGENYSNGKIPLEIKGLASGTTTVNTVAPEDWTKLKKPQIGDNYIVALRDGDAPAQSVFLLGNEDALREDWFLKRKDDLNALNNYYMWQVATGISVTFDKNGGDTEADPNRRVQEQNPNGNHFELPSVQPTREGYEFTGWNTKADGTGAAFTAETEVRQSLTVYAQWARKQTEIAVTFDKNGGDTDADPRVMTQKVDEGASARFELPSVQPTREGYEFTGWNTKADGTGAAFTAETEVKQSLTVYAQWTRRQTKIAVTFDKNGGDTEADPRVMTQKVDEGANARFELPSVQPTREGYEFTGWNTKADGMGAAFTAETEVKQSLTVYAQWTRKQIEKEDTISVTVKKVWKLNDGGTATDSVTVALYKNGNMDRTVVLSDANRWTYTWDDLSAKDAWTVEEPEVPNGFKAVVERKGSVFTITNDDIRVDVPQTGDKSHWLLWTVLLLASGLGIAQCVRKGKGKIE